MNKKKSILVSFGNFIPKDQSRYDEVLTPDAITKLTEPGSIYEASALLEEISYLKTAQGVRLSKSFVYKGYELWWMYYNSLYRFFCLPYTQYRKLLEYLKNFEHVYLSEPPFKTLFYYYLKAHGRTVIFLEKRKRFSFPSPGVMMQALLTVVSLPILILKRPAYLIFTGDKFESGKDYDFRFAFLYRELRERKLSFVECIRSLESWKSVLQHAFVVRKRPVIYSEAIAHMTKFFNFKSFHEEIATTDVDIAFKFSIGTHYLKDVYADVSAIRVMKWMLRITGVKAAYITAVLDRNFHAFVGAKLNGIPTLGILHGVASRYYNAYDFLPGFDGEKSLSVDRYGLWSTWWKEYYEQHSDAYTPNQLYVSGPMRPLEKNEDHISNTTHTGPINVLFVSEQLAVPEETIPYLKALLEDKDIEVFITFRHYRDEFESWLHKYHPDILGKIKEKNIIRTGIKDALLVSEVAVGTMSTAVIEALFTYKVPILFYTKQWGDYFSLKEYEKGNFFSKNPEELLARIKKARSLSHTNLKDLRERYFGDPHVNGSKWVIDQLEDAVLNGRFTK